MKIGEEIHYNRNNAEILNPILFDEDNKLYPIIKKKIEKIVEIFLEYTQVDVKVLDIRIVGSNAAYNYQTGSDLDIHIVTDLSKVSDPETIARLYFDSIKKNFKDSYDIKIKGIEVEIYVEDVNSSAQSNGIYSVKTDSWVKEPTPTEEPSDEVMMKAQEIEDEIIFSVKKATTVDEIEDIVDKLYMMRKDSLSVDGETGAGNLAFKSLRNRGILDKLKDTLRDEASKELSLESKEIVEDTSPLKTLKGSAIKRSKYGVGKEIGGQVYFHKDYINDIPPAKELYEIAKEILLEEYPEFKWNCLMWDKSRPSTLRFDEAPDFDTAREPIPGTMMSVNTETGDIIKRFSPQIWHHKWLWVKDDYRGFDVEESHRWSETWLQKITHPSGYLDKWKQELSNVGLD